jgi:hypothetical protein
MERSTLSSSAMRCLSLSPFADAGTRSREACDSLRCPLPYKRPEARPAAVPGSRPRLEHD